MAFLRVWPRSRRPRQTNAFVVFAALAAPALLLLFTLFARESVPRLPRRALSSRELLHPTAVNATFGVSSTSMVVSSTPMAPGIAVNEEGCEETYGVLPCSTSIVGNLFLMVAYGYLILIAAQLISEGSEHLLQVLDPGIIGGLLLPILGAFPDTLLIVVSGTSGSKAEAQDEVLVGMGVLAGSTIMILTIAWGGSLLCGRCDLVARENGDSVAKDRTLTRPLDIVTTGVTTDEQTRVGAWIMVYTMAPYLIMQVPIFLHGDLEVQGHWASLVGLFVAVIGLVGYCTYQVMSPWLQRMRMGEARLHYIRTLAVRDIYNLARSKTYGALIDADGSVSSETLEKMFDAFDDDQSGGLSKQELKALILGLGVRQGAVPQEEELQAWLKEFDVNSDEDVTKPEFVSGMTQWILKVLGSHRPGLVDVSAHPLRQNTTTDSFWNAQANNAQGEYERLAEDAMNEDEEEEEERVPQTPLQIIRGAVILIAAGAVLVAIFADPVVDSISGFSRAATIPPFFVAFVACPIASNASELLSSLIFAMKKKKRTISLTYSQVYGAITMNNTLCMGAFLAVIFFRGLVWDFSSEVTVIVLSTLIVGYVGGSRKTFPTWMAFAILSLYPISLLTVVVLDFWLGWK